MSCSSCQNKVKQAEVNLNNTVKRGEFLNTFMNLKIQKNDVPREIKKDSIKHK